MSYRKILTVVSEHTSSTITARYALALAQKEGAGLLLYSAHAEGTDESILRHAERHTEHLFAAAAEHAVPVTSITETGMIARLLPLRVRSEQVDLVFYPLPHTERYGARIQKHTVHHLLAMVPADLAILRIMHMGKPHPRHILVPLGGNVADAEARVRFLAALGHSFHSQITMFHRRSGKPGELPPDVSDICHRLRLQHLPVLERSGVGNIARAIITESISHHNDLIVLGASQRTLLQRLFFGSPAGDIMHASPCNAILFRAALS